MSDIMHDYDTQITYNPGKDDEPSIRRRQLPMFVSQTRIRLVAEAMSDIQVKGDISNGTYYSYLVADVRVDVENETYDIEYVREDTGL